MSRRLPHSNGLALRLAETDDYAQPAPVTVPVPMTAADAKARLLQALADDGKLRARKGDG